MTSDISKVIAEIAAVRNRSISQLAGDAMATAIYGGNNLRKNGLIQRLQRITPSVDVLINRYKQGQPIKITHKEYVNKQLASGGNTVGRTNKGGRLVTRSVKRPSKAGIAYVPGTNIRSYYEVLARSKSRGYTAGSLRFGASFRDLRDLDNYTYKTTMSDGTISTLSKVTTPTGVTVSLRSGVDYKHVDIDAMQSSVMSAILADRQGYYNRIIASR